MVSIIAITCRCIAFTVTLLPAPAFHCEQFPPAGDPTYPVFNPPKNAKDILDLFMGLDTDGGCGDLVFSSHQMYGLLVLMMVVHYSKKLLFKIFIFLMCVALSCLILAQRSHYSLDVIVAWFSVPSFWIVFAHFFPWDPVQHIAFWRDQPIIIYEKPLFMQQSLFPFPNGNGLTNGHEDVSANDTTSHNEGGSELNQLGNKSGVMTVSPTNINNNIENIPEEVLPLQDGEQLRSVI